MLLGTRLAWASKLAILEGDFRNWAYCQAGGFAVCPFGFGEQGYRGFN